LNLESSNHTKLTRGVKLMGNAFQFTAVCKNELLATQAIDEAIGEVTRIENLLSTYKPESIVNQINDAAGVEAINVPKEVFELIQRCIKISNITQGAFDITFGSIDKSLWNFDRSMKQLPSANTIRDSIALVNYKNIILDGLKCSVLLKNKGMRIGFGGIGKGYAAERAKLIMKNLGCHSGVVNAAGDMTAWGNDIDGGTWSVGIADPDDKSKIISTFSLSEKSVATSGDYEKFILIDGIRYSHTINPKTGYPIRGIKSVSIICENAELADALTTPTMILGVENGLSLINQLNGVECIIIDEKNAVYLSNKIKPC
jgi:FAD:protein FMN transferase